MIRYEAKNKELQFHTNIRHVSVLAEAGPIAGSDMYVSKSA